MSTEQSSFASKFISRLGKIDAPQIESFLTQLVKEKDLQRAVFDALQEAVVVVGADGRVVFANEACRGLLGFDPRKSVGEPLRRCMKARSLRALAEELAEEPRRVDRREFRVRTPSPRLYSVSVVPIGGEEDGAAGLQVWIVGDRTAENDRAREQQQLESIQSLATLTAGIAHEIKNPLNSLNIHAQLIARSAREISKRGDDVPEADRLVHSAEVLIEEIARVTRIVDQFIKAARPPRLALRMADLNDVVRDVARLIEPECQHRGIALELDLDPAMPRVEIDADQIRQAVVNLAKNALEAIDKPEGHVALRTMLGGEAAVVEVEDNGCGISEADRLRIFEPYHTTKFEGSGLGLMVVFRIVQAHNGAIVLDSDVGRGSSFRIALPLTERPVRLLEGTDEGGAVTPSGEGIGPSEG